MDIFGWGDHATKIEAKWKKLVKPEDLVLLPGDISWAKHLDEAMVDLEWIDQLPGTKVMIKGNHDYWWQSIGKLRVALPPSIHALQHDVYNWEDVTIGGTRLWDSPDYHFAYEPEPDPKTFERELGRLEMSLKQLNPKASLRVAMTHYPPMGLDCQASRVTEILEKHKIDICVFGHLHGMDPKQSYFGDKNGIKYVFCACDYLDFTPLQLR